MSDRSLSNAVDRAEAGVALYVWRVGADDPWRITDWEGVPGEGDRIEADWCARVDLFGARGVGSLVAQANAPDEFDPA